MLSDEDSQRLTRSVFGSHQDVTDGGMIARELDGIRTELRAMRTRGLEVLLDTPIDVRTSEKHHD